MSQDSGPVPLEGGRSKRSIIEQHAQSVLLVVISSALVYSGTFVVGAREDAVRTQTQLAALTQEVAAVRAQLAALQANYTTREDYRDHEMRLRQIESRVRQ